MTKTTKNSSSFFEVIQELKKRGDDLRVIPLSDNPHLQSLLAVWELVTLQTSNEPEWSRKLPISEAGADELCDFIW
ncbi:MAG: hypothetical protein JRC86_04775, partial [Deltaproteobacteria bacterium]|nr:hypothetical protein [Deltaproteobacteria bacterium]